MDAQAYDPISQAPQGSIVATWVLAWFLGVAAVCMREAWTPPHGSTVTNKAPASTLSVLIVARVAWRLAHPGSASLGHLALRALALTALPVSGWPWGSVTGRPVAMFGLVRLPPLTTPAQECHALAKRVHVTLAWMTGALVLGRARTAPKHHLPDRDDVLRGMPSAPRLRVRAAPPGTAHGAAHDAYPQEKATAHV